MVSIASIMKVVFDITHKLDSKLNKGRNISKKLKPKKTKCTKNI
jgi:hypothetical protein